jgi:hypothetical protein
VSLPESKSAVNIAEEVIDWLYTEQLQIDEQWSYLLPTGFTWWADQYAQTVEIVGEQTGPDGEAGYLICVRTELLRDLDLTEAALVEINALPMRCASMAGPVYDVAARRLDLWSLVRVSDDNGSWMRFLLGAAAVIQLAEARMLAPILAQATGALTATSAHPESGARAVADEMTSAAKTFVSSADQACAWPEAEFRDAVSHFRNRPPAMAATAGVRGFTVEFPFGEQTSLCEVLGDQPHPLYGNGLLVLQRFPVDARRAGAERLGESTRRAGAERLGESTGSESEGIRLALSLNAADLTRELTGYGLGSYVHADGMIYFTGFLPNALHKPGLLPTIYSSCAARAQAMAARFVDGRWNADAYSLDSAVLARRLEQQRATMPVLEQPVRGCPMMRARTGGA